MQATGSDHPLQSVAILLQSDCCGCLQAAGPQGPNAEGTVNSPVGVLMASLMAEAARSGVTAAPTPW